MVRAFVCPACRGRVCDSGREISVLPLSKTTEKRADILIKCKKCGARLAIKVLRTSTVAEPPKPS